jgi:hypothetical protein
MTQWRNVTLSVPWDIYYHARAWAAQRDMSLSAVVTRFLENLPYHDDYQLPPPRKRSNQEPLTNEQRFEQAVEILHLNDDY